MDTPDDVYASPDGVIEIARFGPIFAGVYNKGLTAHALDGLRNWQRRIMPDELICSFSLSFAADRLPPEAAAATDRLLSEFRDRTAASATVLRVFGFEGSAARAMLGTIYLVTRAAYPRKVFANVADGTTWLTKLRDGCESVGAASRWLTTHEKANLRQRRRSETNQTDHAHNDDQFR